MIEYLRSHEVVLPRPDVLLFQPISWTTVNMWMIYWSITLTLEVFSGSLIF